MAIAGFMTACNSKKDEKKPEETTTTTDQPATDKPATDQPTAPTADMPTFSDPEVQKFVTEYTAFVKEYKAGITDPTKAAALAKTAQEWSTKMTSIGMKLASNPDDAKKWADWTTWLAKEMTPVTK